MGVPWSLYRAIRARKHKFKTFSVKLLSGESGRNSGPNVREPACCLTLKQKFKTFSVKLLSVPSHQNRMEIAIPARFLLQARTAEVLLLDFSPPLPRSPPFSGGRPRAWAPG